VEDTVLWRRGKLAIYGKTEQYNTSLVVVHACGERVSMDVELTMTDECLDVGSSGNATLK
jgi:hypothetical protein